MKKIVFLALIIFTINSCTSIDETITIDVQDYSTTTHTTINTDLKVVNLVVDQDEFNEMYDNYNEFEEVEIEGFFNLYKNGELLIEDEVVELEIKGKVSAQFDLKSLGVKFDDTYNNTDRVLIDVETLPFHSIDKIKAFRLRNSGNDFEDTMLKDISYTKLAIDAGLDIDLTYAEQTVVFVNGSYLGIMNLRTEANRNGIYRLYKEDKDDITLAKINHGGTLEKKNGDFDKIDRLITAIDTNDLDFLLQEIDLNNFIDYMVFQSMIGNSDWPSNNVRFFAIKEGPFRFIMFDLDKVAIKDLDADPLDFINNPVKNPVTDLFNVLYADSEFKNNFNSRFDEIKNSGALSPEKFNAIVSYYKSNIELQMPMHIEKYNNPSSFTDWYLNLEKLKNDFSTRIKNLD